jgi:hypothetical protein
LPPPPSSSLAIDKMTSARIYKYLFLTSDRGLRSFNWTTADFGKMKFFACY